MKSPRAKLHLLDVDEPLLSFHELECRCGIVLHDAVAKFMESQDLPSAVKPSSWPIVLGLCAKCLGKEPKDTEEKRTYCYGLMEGEEAIRQNSEVEEAVA